VLGLIFTALVSVPLGIHSALHRGKWIDSAISFFTQLFSSVPSYCFAIFLVLLFALRLKLLPSFYTDSIRGHILPVLMISTADQCFRENTDVRKAIIRRTWENAVSAGDKNAYFLDGQTIYQDVGLDFCTVDGTHPNDLGFWCMANAIGAEIQKIMEW
jgi:ABC-type proline/glycine betaine transport system permease subunit